MTYHIHIVEDDHCSAKRLENVLNSNNLFNVNCVTKDIASTMVKLKERKPDVMLLDLGLPDGNGIELIHSITGMKYDTRIMVMSVLGDKESVISAIEAGALGYILKDDKPENINQLVMQLIKGGSPISPSIAKYLLDRFKSSIDTPNLTEKEKEILQLITKGYIFKEIANYLDVTPHTISTHVKNIYRKLSVHSRGEAVFEAIKLGIAKI